MKRIMTNVSLAINVAFLISVLAVAYQFVSGDLILSKSNTQSHFIVLGVFALGLLSILFSYIKTSFSAVRDVIFVDRISESAKEETIIQQAADMAFVKDLRKETETFKRLVWGRQRDNAEVLEQSLSYICNTLNAGQGIVFKALAVSGQPTVFQLLASYAYVSQTDTALSFKSGEGLVGMVGKENKALLIDDVPEGYITIFSGLGKSSPRFLSILPIVNESAVVTGVVEIAFFREPMAEEKAFLNNCVKLLGGDVEIALAPVAVVEQTIEEEVVGDDENLNDTIEDTNTESK